MTKRQISMIWWKKTHSYNEIFVILKKQTNANLELSEFWRFWPTLTIAAKLALPLKSNGHRIFQGGRSLHMIGCKKEQKRTLFLLARSFERKCALKRSHYGPFRNKFLPKNVRQPPFATTIAIRILQLLGYTVKA